MTEDGSRRFAFSGGAMLADPVCLGKLPLPGLAADGAAAAVFDPGFWAARGVLNATDAGRGASWFVGGTDPDGADYAWVLRHYRRGGWAARVSADRYLFLGEANIRSFAEFRLLSRLHALGLPVPLPIAAGYRRSGLLYRCDLITQRIPGALPLSVRLANAALPDATWRAVGAALAKLHRAGLDHADLNSHNILLDERGVISVIDLDRGRMRRQGAWVAGNMNRLQRSLQKVSRSLPRGRWSADAWRQLLTGYGDAALL